MSAMLLVIQQLLMRHPNPLPQLPFQCHQVPFATTISTNNSGYHKSANSRDASGWPLALSTKQNYANLTIHLVRTISAKKHARNVLTIAKTRQENSRLGPIFGIASGCRSVQMYKRWSVSRMIPSWRSAQNHATPATETAHWRRRRHQVQ